MDVGEDVKRRKGNAGITHAAKAMSKNAAQLMAQWTEDNFYAYVETMEMIRQNAPVQWARLYQEAIKMGLAKETNININFNRQQDREGLQCLVRARMLTDHTTTTYTPYEEVEYAALPKQQKEEDR